MKATTVHPLSPFDLTPRPDEAPKPGTGIDRTVIRRLLELTPAERIKLAVIEARNLAAFDSAVAGGRVQSE